MNLIRVGKSLFVIAFFFMLIIGCSTSEKTNKDLNGKSIESVIEILEQPDSNKEFILTKKLFEYQYALLTYFPDPEGKDLHIKEYIWKNKRTKTVVWFHKVNDKWESIDNLTWNPDKTKY
jgi:hypothetical protein